MRGMNRVACGLLLAVSALGGGAAMAQIAAPSANGIGSPFELAFWQSVATSEDRAQYEAYLSQYPQGTFSALARAKIAAIDRLRPAGAAPAPAVPASMPAPAPAPVPAPAAVAVEPGAPVAPVAAATASSAPTAFPAMSGVAAPAAPAPVSTPVSTPVPAPVAAAPAAAPAVDPFAKLAALRKAAAEGAQPAPAVATPAAPAASALPARPQLAAVPPVDLPTQFCSAEERNRFHDGVYKPAVAVADRNNQLAIGYMDSLQAAYDARSKAHEIEMANGLAKEAGAYRPVAEEAYSTRTGFIALFDRLMAVPIAPCAKTGA